MKNIGIMIISLICILAGNYFAHRVTERIVLLETIKLMIKYIETQIEYTRTPISSLLGYLCDNNDFKKLTFLPKIKEDIESGTDLNASWHKNAFVFIKNSALHNDDGRLLVSFSDILGASDLNGQIQNCETYINLFEMKLCSLRQKSEGSVKIYNMLGLMFATFAAIILF